MISDNETLAVRKGVVRSSATVSRFIVLSLILIWRTFLRPYDTSSVLDPSCLSSPVSIGNHSSLPWPSFAAAIEGSIVWDAVHFVRIAQCGYEYEHSYAFLPLLPIAISILSCTVFAPLVPLIGKRAVLGLSGYVLCNTAFLFSVEYFYRISVIILRDRDAALRASILFCFNPASIFYSTIYSESFYSLFYLGGLYHYMSGSDNGAMLYFAISAFARSNGILNAGYFCYRTLWNVKRAFILRKSFHLAVRAGLAGGLRCLFIFIPFIAFQVYGYYNLCLGNGEDKERPWCKSTPPLLYNYIQSHYWNVGFLRYFKVKQVPNFVLASPILLLSFCTVAHYFNSLPETALYFGFLPYFSNHRCSTSRRASPPLRSPDRNRGKEGGVRRRKGKDCGEEYGASWLKEKGEGGWPSLDALPLVLHLAFMASTAFLFMHVQVATRFLSCCPPLYWYASMKRGRRWGYFIWVYFSSYILLGTLLFSNFYPFT